MNSKPTSRSSIDLLSFVIPTAGWSARAPKQTPSITKPKFVIVHHTGVMATSHGTLLGAQNLARAIQRDHMSRGWIDSGHNFLVTNGGFVLEGRHGSLNALRQGKCVRSAHTVRANESPGIEVEGNFSLTAVGKTQWNALVHLVSVICFLTGIDPTYIKGHRQFNATQCPGNWLYAQLGRLRADVRAELKVLQRDDVIEVKSHDDQANNQHVGEIRSESASDRGRFL